MTCVVVVVVVVEVDGVSGTTGTVTGGLNSSDDSSEDSSSDTVGGVVVLLLAKTFDLSLLRSFFTGNGFRVDIVLIVVVGSAVVVVSLSFEKGFRCFNLNLNGDEGVSRGASVRLRDWGLFRARFIKEGLKFRSKGRRKR